MAPISTSVGKGKLFKPSGLYFLIIKICVITCLMGLHKNKMKYVKLLA